MDKLRNRLRLLALLNIYYVYEIIKYFLAKDLILEIYFISFTLLFNGVLLTYYIMKKKTQKGPIMLKSEGQKEV